MLHTEELSNSGVKRFSKYYSTLAVVLLNTLIIFVFINLLSHLIILVRDHFVYSNPVANKYGDEPLEVVYPDMTQPDREVLLRETWSRPYVYEEFTQFKESFFEGKYVNVSEHGFRYGIDQAVWPPSEDSFNIFLFGGSTVFGYGVADNQTVASHMQLYLNKNGQKKVNIYNFGRGHYYSSQERILFEKLLVSNYVPDVAVFVDGLNEFYFMEDKPLYSERLENVVSGKEEINSSFIEKMPLIRILTSLVKKATNNFLLVDNTSSTNKNANKTIIDRYLANKKIIESIAKSYDVSPVFVWQPVPTYKYDNSEHLFSAGGYGRHEATEEGYNIMRDYFDKNILGNNFLWSADIQEELKEPLYVDKVHHSAKFAKILGEFIGEFLLNSRIFTD